MIGHTKLFLWPRYSEIISLLTITMRGYRISIAYCLFFISFCLVNAFVHVTGQNVRQSFYKDGPCDNKT